MQSNSWHSYPSIFNLGHRAIADLFNHDVVIEEKVDGSQFSFGFFPGADHELRVRSKRVEFNIDAPEGMFKAACATVKELHRQSALLPNYTYRAEVFAKPKHNALAYDRVPAGNLILFDINCGHEEYYSYDDKFATAKLMGLEVVPRLFEGRITDVAMLRDLLDTVSTLGGQKIEGVVIKPANRNVFGIDKKLLLGKFVSEAFREVHKQEWKKENPTTTDVIGVIAATMCTPARWNKAIQHMLEEGKITGENVQDIGPCMVEIPKDVLKECEDDIKEALFKYAWPHIKRACTRGFPEFYKERLMRQQFDITANSADNAAADRTDPC